MDFTALDVVLVIVLLCFFAVGITKGLWVTLGGVLGFLLGAIAALFAIPMVASWIETPFWRVAGVLIAALVLVIAGYALGVAAGGEIKRSVTSSFSRGLSRVVGGIANVAVGVLAIAAVSFSVSAVGSSVANQQIRDSTVIGAVDRAMPDQAQSVFAYVRSLVIESNIPEIAQLLVPESPAAPENLDLGEAAQATSQSVGRITGVAEQCGQTQTGSGFAASTTRVITNAHVVSGVDEPSVEMPNGEVAPARVVYFNADHDLAVLAVDPLSVNPVAIGEDLNAGASGHVMGYPSGGPFSSGPATVQAREFSRVNNIYGDSPDAMEIYQINADVRQGNSGGPLVNESGEVVGVIFARSVEGSNVGFAITGQEAGEVLTSPDQFTETVGTGTCVQQ